MIGARHHSGQKTCSHSRATAVSYRFGICVCRWDAGNPGWKWPASLVRSYPVSFLLRRFVCVVLLILCGQRANIRNSSFHYVKEASPKMYLPTFESVVCAVFPRRGTSSKVLGTRTCRVSGGGGLLPWCPDDDPYKRQASSVKRMGYGVGVWPPLRLSGEQRLLQQNYS